MRKALWSILPLICLAMLCACGGSDDNGGDNGKTNDNGTGIENNGGNGETVLSPDDEKSFLEETSRVFMSYFNANEFEEMSNVAKQIRDLGDDDDDNDAYSSLGKSSVAKKSSDSDDDDDDIEDWIEDIMVKTLTASGTSEYWPYNYEYYDALIKASNVKGTYEASYTSGKWVRTKTTGDATINYTDKNGAKWTLTVVPSDGIKGEVYGGKDRRYSGYKETRYDFTFEVPGKVTALLTRQGQTQVSAELIVNSLNIKDQGKNTWPTVMSSANGTFHATVLAYDINTSFNYAPNSGNSVSATVKKGNTTLVTVNAKGTNSINSSKNEFENGKNITADIDVLGRVQLHATCSDAKTFSDASNRADENDDEEDVVKDCAKKMNSVFSAYITNNGGSKEQGTIKISTTSEKDYYTYYYLTPTINFSDGTYYDFDEYFSEKYFQKVIDMYNQLIKDFEDLGD